MLFSEEIYRINLVDIITGVICLFLRVYIESQRPLQFQASHFPLKPHFQTDFHPKQPVERACLFLASFPTHSTKIVDLIYR